MAQAGYTPIQLYYSNTATNAPAALVNGELAINQADGKLYYRNSAGAVTLFTAGGASVTSISFGSTGLTPSTATAGVVSVAGTLGSGYGGTGFSTYAAGDLIYASAVNTLAKLTAGTNGDVLTLAAGLPTWAPGGSGGVTSWSGGTTGLTPNSPNTGAIVIAGTLEVVNGGTGQAVYTTGDILYASSTITLQKLSPTVNGYVLTLAAGVPTWAASSGGVSSFSAGSTGLTPNTATTGAISLAGTLGSGYGGTGFSTYAAGDLIYASAVNTLAKLTAGTNGYVLTLAAGVPTWAASTGGVTSFSAGTTGFTPSSSTTGAITLAGTLNPANGGTGANTLTGYVYGNGVGAMTASATIPTTDLSGTVTNAQLANSSVTIGTTAISLGGTSLTLGGLTSVAVTTDPTSPLQLATKQYVDGLVSTGLVYHQPVQATTTGTLASITGGTVTYNNGVAGVGATLTFSVALSVLDGYTLLNTNRILVKDEVTQANNGVYTWATGGSVLTRATDADTYGTGVNQLSQNDYFFTQNGTINKGTSFVVTTVGAITFGTTAITFAEFSSSIVYTSTSPIVITGSVISLNTVPSSKGGTGFSTYAAGDLLYASAINTLATLTAGTNGHVLTLSGGLPAWAAIPSNVTTISFGLTGLTPSTATSGVVSVAGTLGAGYGGTGLSTFAIGDIMYASAATTISKLAIGTAGQVMMVNAGGTAPQWSAPLSGFTAALNVAAPNATNNVSSITASGGTTIQFAALVPKSTGGVLAAIPDSTATGGNVRGTNSVDWQTTRSAAAQVASGASSVIAGGANNQADGSQSAVVGGASNQATGANSFVGGGSANTISSVGQYGGILSGNNNAITGLSSAIIGGGYSTDRGITHARVFGSNNMNLTASTGLQQVIYLQVGFETSTATLQILNSQSTGAASATNQMVLANNTAYAFQIICIAGVTGAGASKAWRITGAIKRGATAASTILVGTPSVDILAADAAASAWLLNVVADTTNGALQVQATGAAATTIRWNANIESSQIGY